MENTTKQDGRENVSLEQKELDQIQNDINKAKSSLVSSETKKEIAQAKDEARKDAEKEFAINQKIKEQEQVIENLKKEKIEKEKEFDDKFSTMETKVNELIGSKAPANTNNPFKEESSQSEETDPAKMSDEQVEDIERNSGVAFLGDEFLRKI